jgi:bacillopeptidase F
MDTGVDGAHPDLQPKWRGGSDSWWDPWRHTTAPYDADGHGTNTMGILTDVAPGAQWIAAKIYDDGGNTTVSVIHEAFQWLLTPSGNPAAPDAPDVVNASWGMEAVNNCDTTFQADIEAMRAAGIAVVFAAGNAGPAAWTSLSPANNGDAVSVGAVDDSNAIAYFSSRGASSCTDGVFPDVVAPGVNVKAAAISLGGVAQYTYVSGTSFSAPHVAGVLALLAGAFPQAAVAQLEGVLRATAIDLGPVGPDDTYGFGLIDAWAAYEALTGNVP